MMRGGCAAVAIAVCLTATSACGGGDGDDVDLDFEGEPGRAIPAAFDGWVPGVDASLDGSAASHFLIDTGAPVTLVDTDDFSALAEGWHALDLELGGLRFPGLEVGALDVFAYVQTQGEPFTGIIGGNILTSFALSLDYQGGRVWLEREPADLPADLSADAVDAPIAIDALVAGGGAFRVGGELREIGATRFLVRVAVEDQADEDGFWVLVDSGASSVVLDGRLLDSLGDQGRPRLEGIAVGTAGGEQTAYLTRVWNLRVSQPPESGGDLAVEQASVAVLALPDDTIFESISDEVGADVRGILGGMFLRRYAATIDYPGESLRLLPYREQDHIDPQEFTGVGFLVSPDGDDWVVTTVYPDTDAEAKGVAFGDVVAELDGASLTGLAIDEVTALFASYDVGDAAQVGLARGGAIEVLEVEVEDLLPEFEAPQ